MPHNRCSGAGIEIQATEYVDESSLGRRIDDLNSNTNFMALVQKDRERSGCPYCELRVACRQAYMIR